MAVPLPGRSLTARRQRVATRGLQKALQRPRRLFLPHPPPPPAAPVELPTITVEAGFDSWPFESQADTIWTDITALSQSLAVRAGRSSEDAEYQAATMSLVLDNRDRRFDPTNLASPYRRAVLESNTTGWASTPDAAAWDWTTELDVRVLVHDDTMARQGSLTFYLASKDNVTAALSSWEFYMTEGEMYLAVSNGSTYETAGSGQFADLPLWDEPVGPVWLRATWQVTGANKTVRFYRRPIDDPSWSLFSDTTSAATVLSLNNSTAPVRLGGTRAPDRILSAWLDDTINGFTPIGSPDFTAGSLIGDSSFVDGQGNTWTINDPAVIIDDGSTVRPGRRIRARASLNGEDKPLFSGFLRSAPITPTPPSVNDLKIECVDATDRLATALPHDSVWALAIYDRQTSPVAATRKPIRGWYRLNESSGFSADNSSVLQKLPAGSWHKAAGAGTFATGTGSLLPYSANGAGSFDGNTWIQIVAAVNDSVYTVECWIQTTQAAATLVDGSNLVLRLAAGQPQIGAYNLGTARQAATRVDDGKLHHIVATVAPPGSPSIRIWVDGQSESLSTVALAGGVTADIRIGEHKNGTENFTGALDEIVLYGTADPGSLLAGEHYTAATAPWDGDTPAQRINRVLDLVGWPTAERRLDIGVTVLPPEALGDTALTVMRRIAATDRGRLFVDPEGYVTFHAGNHEQVTDDYTVRATWGDGGGAEHPYERMPEFTWDTNRVVNSVSGHRRRGSSLTRFDRASQLDFGERHVDLGLIEVDDNAALTIVLNDVLARYSQPRTRPGSITIRPIRQSSDMWRRVLESRIGHHHVVTYRPGIGLPLEFHGRVEQIEHDIKPGSLASWATTFTLGEGDSLPGTFAIGKET